MLKKSLFLLGLTLVLNACSQPTRDTVANIKDVTVVPDSITDSTVPLPNEELEQINWDSTKLTYSWLQDFEIENTLVNRIAVPNECRRIEVDRGSYQDWLRHLPLKSGRSSVLLYNGELKWNQDVHQAVIDMDVDPRDLQQCADAVMRMKAEYHYQKKEFDQIHFNYTSGDNVPFSKWIQGKRPVVSGRDVVWNSCSSCDESYNSFRKYLLKIFNYAGTASMERELKPKSWKDIKAGDVIIKGGSPGHAVMVLDVAVNQDTGDKLFLISQSYMPAQQSHILKNPQNSTLSPWYSVEEIGSGNVVTPEWTFDNSSLMEFGY
jgi:hypothetical protein